MKTRVGGLDLRPLPERAAEVLRALGAPPRLVAHLALVHDTAHRLTAELAARWPALRFDRDTVLLGAATHDVGKTVHREELVQPGRRHEEAGPDLLRRHGFPEAVARIARSHGRWRAGLGEPPAQPAPLEDLLVALADAVWRGRRDDELERTVVAAVEGATGEEEWSVLLGLDDVLSRLTAGADERIRWQGRHPA